MNTSIETTMIGARFRLKGRWAQFRKPETNNTPLTHDFITKTAMLGLMGAVLGIERSEFRDLFPTLCEDIVYGVQVQGVVKKESWAFTLRNVNKPNDPAEKAPRQMEFIRDPDFVVAIALSNLRSVILFQDFLTAIANDQAKYTPVFGLHNCPAEIYFTDTGEFIGAVGDFRTKGFVLRSQKPQLNVDAPLRLGFERIPTFQDSNWWNKPDTYRDVVYPCADTVIGASGQHYTYSDGEAWCLI
jgi:CRISPR-associated protein Cas5h